uniref:7TM GPCR serpentine receptor class x (Srx) domain-containing protein n=1 Tax=Acrobeloides nanus TaxID=290746 RepID=A0A914CM30_9BILA
MRCKVYNIQESFKNSDKVLAVQFVILCGIQFILSNTENYLVDFEANNPSYWSLLRFSVPYDVLIINAVLLMTFNHTLRKAFLRTFCNPCRKIKVHNLAMQGSKLHTDPKNLQARPTIVMTTA